MPSELARLQRKLDRKLAILALFLLITILLNLAFWTITMHRIHISYSTSTPTIWRLESPYTRATSIGEITVPKGFIWDGASIPRQLHDILPRWGSYSGAALIHDWLYSAKPCRREKADLVFHQLMLEDGVHPWRAKSMWLAVRKFGTPAWNRSTRTVST